MEILNVVKTADRLAPNSFTLDEKLAWCNEVSLYLRRNVKKYYDIIETVVTCPSELELPNDIRIDDVESVYVGGRALDKTDLRSLPYLSGGELRKRYGIDFMRPKIMRVVYLTSPIEVKDISIRGTFDLNESEIIGSELPFHDSDMLECVLLTSLEDEAEWADALSSYVYENDGTAVRLTDDIFTPQTGAYMAIRRVIDDETEVDAPYDRMYVEYILAKIALYQHDYETYTAHMIQYNNLFEDYLKDYKTRNPLNDLARFRNLW